MLTAAQLQALKTFITNESSLNALPNTSEGNFAVAAALNALAVPDFWGWKTTVSRSELTNSVGPEGTTFTWVGNGFITRSAGEQAAWRELFEGTAAVNAAQANVRQAFADILSGTGNAAANRTHLLAVARRRATVGEKVLATGTGSQAAPATFGFEGLLTYPEVQAARDLP